MNLIVIPICIVFLFDLLRNPRLPKGWKLALSVLLLDLALDLVKHFVVLPVAIQWVRHWISVAVWVAYFAAALIGIPLWLRSKIRYV